MIQQLRIILSLLLLSASPAWTETALPIVGLWGFDGCENHEEIEYQGNVFAAYTGTDGIEIIEQKIQPLTGSDWYLVRTGPDDPAPSLMRVRDKVLFNAWPKEEPSTEEAIASLNAQLESGALTPEKMPEAFDIHTAQTCNTLPLPQSLLLGETLAVLIELDRAVSTCQQAFEECPSTVFTSIDKTNDGELSVAEMARAIRSSIAISAVINGEITETESAAALATGTLMAPIASAAFLHSFDYDASGTLSFEELLGERLPSKLSKPQAANLSLFDWVNAVSESARAAAGLGAAMLP